MNEDKALKLAEYKATLWQILYMIEIGEWTVEDFEPHLSKLLHLWSDHWKD